MSISTRAPMLPMAANDRRSLNFVSDQLTDGFRFRALRSFTIAPENVSAHSLLVSSDLHHLG